MPNSKKTVKKVAGSTWFYVYVKTFKMKSAHSVSSGTIFSHKFRKYIMFGQ